MTNLMVNLDISNSVIYILCKGPKEVLLNQLNIEAFITLEGIKPLTSGTTLVGYKGPLPIQLELPWVQLKGNKKGHKRLHMGDWPEPGLRYKMKHRVLGIQHLFPAQIFIVPDVFGRPQGSQGTDRNGILKLGEGKSVVADRLASVKAGLSAPSHGEIV